MSLTPADLTRCDLLIRAGTVVDGSGRPAYRADVALTGDRVAAIGDLAHVQAEQVIEAAGHVVAPGFIDIHTHDDRALLDAGAMTPKVSQGVTTVVTGNCGISLAPVVAPGALPATFELLGDAAGFRYPAFRDYLETLERHPAAVNAACLVGHSTLRLATVPELGRAATEAEVTRMQALLAESLDAGAVGLSSGLYYPVSRAAPTAEVVALGRVMQSRGGLYATHMRDEGDGVEQSIEETLAIGREAGVPVLISHHKVIGPRNFGRSVRTLR
jgi:N-acyl-D-amino-acid deacylase